MEESGLFLEFEISNSRFKPPADLLL
jgi:hypothetical protein